MVGANQYKAMLTKTTTYVQELETYRVFTAEQDFKYASETFLQVADDVQVHSRCP